MDELILTKDNCAEWRAEVNRQWAMLMGVNDWDILEDYPTDEKLLAEYEGEDVDSCITGNYEACASDYALEFPS